jgi:hypothetical protein
MYTNFLNGKSVIINKEDGSKYAINATIFSQTSSSDAHIMIPFDTTTNPDKYYVNGQFLIYYIDNELLFSESNNEISMNVFYHYLTHHHKFTR